MTDVDNPRLGPYYLDEDGKVGNVSIDPHGIPVVHYGNDVHYNAVTVSQYALELFHQYLQLQNAGTRNRFLKQARWLRDFCVRGKCIFRFSHPPEIYSRVWISGMAQSQFISVQLRAYQLTKDKNFLLAANSAFGYLVKPIRDGGTLDQTAGATWFEEYPQVPSTHVLNGHMFALFGLWDYYRVTRSALARSLFLDGQRTAVDGLRLSDTGFWGRYDLAHAGLCTSSYLSLEIAQLRVLKIVTKSSSADTLITAFSHYTRSARSYVLLLIYNLEHPKQGYEKALPCPMRVA